MNDPQKQQKFRHAKANLQISQLEYICNQFNELCLKINNSGVYEQELTCRKMEIVRVELKSKVKELANNMGELLKIVNKKIHMLQAELEKNVENNQTGTFTPIPLSKHSRSENSQFYEQDRQSPNQSVFNLQKRLQSHLEIQKAQQQKIVSLQQKNQQLIKQFNNLCEASNKKINELKYKIEIIENKQKNQSPIRLEKKLDSKQVEPFLTGIACESFVNQSSSKKLEKTNNFRLGCFPKKEEQTKVKDNGAFLVGSDENLSGKDLNRRMSNLMNVLKDAQQQSTQISHDNSIESSSSSASNYFSRVKRTAI